jgi:hypothetical protein
MGRRAGRWILPLPLISAAVIVSNPSTSISMPAAPCWRRTDRPRVPSMSAKPRLSPWGSATTADWGRPSAVSRSEPGWRGTRTARSSFISGFWPSPSVTRTRLSGHPQIRALGWSARRGGLIDRPPRTLARSWRRFRGIGCTNGWALAFWHPSWHGIGSPGASPSWASSPRRWCVPRRPAGSLVRWTTPAASFTPTGPSGLYPAAAATSRRPSRRSNAPWSCAGQSRRPPSLPV